MKKISLKNALIAASLSLSLISGLQAQPMADKAVLRGKVTDAQGKPLGGAAITLRRSTDIGSAGYWGGVTYTDARGDFEFAGADEGNYYVTVEAAGFAPVQNQQLMVEVQDKNVSYALQLLGIQPLRVQGPDGAALPKQNFPVALSSTDNGTYYQFVPQVDAAGLVTIPGIVPGVYDLNAIVPAAGYAKLSKIEIKSGANAALDLKLQAGGTLQIAAREELADGVKKNLGGVIVSLMAQGQAAGPGVRSLEWMYTASERGRAGLFTGDGDGTADFTNLPPGAYDITLNPAGWGDPQKLTGEVKAGATAVVEMKVKPQPAGAITVKVKKKGGEVLGDTAFSVTAQQMGEVEKASIVPQGAPEPAAPVDPVVNSLARRARTDAEGQFTIYPIPVGRWRFLVRALSEDEDGKAVRTAGRTAIVDIAVGQTVTVEAAVTERKAE